MQQPSQTDYSLLFYDCLEWVEKHKNNLIYGLIALVALLFLVYRLSSGTSARKEADYQTIAKEAALLEKNRSPSPQELQKFADRVDNYPDLLTKYQGFLAQAYLTDQEVSQATPYASGALNALKKDNLPEYLTFSKITLLIANKNEQEALKQSKTLKDEQLNSLNTDSSLLLALNTLQICFLEQRVGSPQNELAAWAEWKKLSAPGGLGAEGDQSGFVQVSQLFQEGGLTLPKYIEAREKALSVY